MPVEEMTKLTGQMHKILFPNPPRFPYPVIDRDVFANNSSVLENPPRDKSGKVIREQKVV